MKPSEFSNADLREIGRWGTRYLAGALGLVLLTVSNVAAYGDEPTDNSLIKVFDEGKAYADLRYRYEFVDQDGIANDAKASTGRARFGFVTGKVYDITGRLEFEVIQPIGNDRFNSTTNGRSAYPTVADPTQREINQLYLSYGGIPNTSVTVGRQRVIFDNARFVGNVGFRQNEQTFDSVVIGNTSLPDTTLTYGFVWNANRIFGDSSPAGDYRTRSHLLNAKYSGFDLISITGYSYLIDLTDIDKRDSSIASTGIRFTGKAPLNDQWKALYTAEYAHQTDYADSTVSNNHNYYTGEVGVTGSEIIENVDVTLKIGYEVLEGDGTRAFQTPLATLHAFNGWTDKFLSTPETGIRDQYVSLGINVLGTKLLGVYHNFDAETGSLDHGSEWGFRMSRKFFDLADLSLKYAEYNADNTGTDTKKLWLTVQTKF